MLCHMFYLSQHRCITSNHTIEVLIHELQTKLDPLAIYRMLLIGPAKVLPPLAKKFVKIFLDL